MHLTVPDWQAITAALADNDALGAVRDARRVSGGDISDAWRLETSNKTFFVKTGPLSGLTLFESEADGLNELASANAVRVPKVLACGTAAQDAFIALEWLDFAPPSAQAERQLGEQLAKLHQHTSAQHGWHRDNTIGYTPQENPWTDDWVGFFCEHRLRYQLQLAKAKGYGGELQSFGAELAQSLPGLFENYSPPPSLLHGDLWGGNWATVDGGPIIFDPAVYYGDRETDIAMTDLFGGFGPAFYAAYESAWPLDDGHQRRRPLYQLYHVLNHLNLFGRGYLNKAEGMTKSLLRSIGG